MSKTHLLLIDIGNTNVKAVIAGPDGPPSVEDTIIVPTFADPAAALEPGLLAACQRAGIAPQDISACAVSSVVPRADGPLAEAVMRLTGVRPRFVPDDLPLGFSNMASIPDNVGADRMVGCYAARRLYPEAANLVVIDYGTATTMDCVCGDEYLGGLTCPGIESSARALTTGTAKLPDLTLTLDGPFRLGFSTMLSLNQGFIVGFAAMTEGLVRRLKDLLGGEALVVATGGLATSVADQCEAIDHVRPDLIPTGLHIAFLERNGRF
ncbi:type III pantothenate kinase [Desulfovibrio ferrophilus]|uniref:Type III pantothenate kinase n=1 Tax=Desulfovibrio ferrophilus TaxID=241368 RepID=A0A2Z6B0B2_9BACT|nr:type III pantothenate kinase [Desulfovibrio ferrophilus]BBD08870.1 type III pantothenate kinase [Desulfovibrio ferrophilus]